MSNIFEKHLHIVSFDIPYPANYGGVIDVFFKIKALSERGVKVHLHCFEYGREHSEVLERLCYSVNYYQRQAKLKKIFQPLPYIVCSRKSQELLDNLKKDDYPILLEGLHSCMVLMDPEIQKRKVFVRTHNIEHEYYQYLAKTERNFRKKLYLMQESSKLSRFESVMHKTTGILAISQKDCKYFSQYYKNVYLIMPYNAFEEVNIIEGKSDYVLYHGKLDISENYHAAEYLVNKVFKGTDIKLKIAGMNSPKHLIKCVEKAPNVELINNPDEKTIHDLISNAQVNILVTSQSTGLKLKLLNALFNGRYCVVNDKMVEGMDVDGLCIIANDPQSIKSIVSDLMKKSFGAAEIEMRKKNMSKFYDLEETTNRLLGLIG